MRVLSTRRPNHARLLGVLCNGSKLFERAAITQRRPYNIFLPTLYLLQLSVPRIPLSLQAVRYLPV